MSGKRRKLGTFATREEVERHERAVRYFKRKGQRLRLLARRPHQTPGVADGRRLAVMI
jgi:hypothetical protein